MKVAIVSESSADEAAVGRLVAAVLKIEIETAGLKVRHRGWPNVCQVLPNILREVYFATDAAGAIVVVDADSSPLHDNAHNAADPENAKCRICQLTQVVAGVVPYLRQSPGRPHLNIAYGLAIPAIEAWLRCGVDAAVSEASWVNARRQNTFPYTTADLKRAVYGTDRPSIDQETAAMTREAERLVAMNQIALLEKLFPLGFGLLASQLRAWNVAPPAAG
ncbi:MAG TPA: hypothetical protein VFV87_19660 [Pirellulaceae bacterium]|nr:hypothetical protein [Pirellulaceae bacterium]